MTSRRRILQSALALPLAALASGRAGALTLPELKSRLASAETLSAVFTQTRTLKGIKKPLRSQGHVFLIRGKGVVWDQTSPFVQRSTVTKNRITLEIEGKKSDEVTAETNPRAFAFAGLVEGLLQGDIEALKQFFAVTGLKALPGDRWRLSLKPREAPVTRIFSFVEVEGGDQVETLQFTSPAGEKTRVDFSGIVVNGEANETIQSRLSR